MHFDLTLLSELYIGAACGLNRCYLVNYYYHTMHLPNLSVILLAKLSNSRQDFITRQKFLNGFSLLAVSIVVRMAQTRLDDF